MLLLCHHFHRIQKLHSLQLLLLHLHLLKLNYLGDHLNHRHHPYLEPLELGVYFLFLQKMIVVMNLLHLNRHLDHKKGVQCFFLNLPHQLMKCIMQTKENLYIQVQEKLKILLHLLLQQ
tara:strand:+ start:220 stop:576 length:357 start_codon:yes stop_codon:yes gene_type:complete